MLKLNTPYTIDNGDIVTFNKSKKGIINGTYGEGALTGTLDGNLLKATFTNPKAIAKGLIEIAFHENGFDAKWKKGLEPGPMRGKWVGKIENPIALNASIPNDIKVLLKNKLINPKVGIDAVYNWLFDYFRNQFNGDVTLSDISLFKNELTDQFALVKNKNTRTIGIDFPILLSSGKNRPVLMVCAMDPLRKESNDYSQDDKISFWVPFSIINSIDSKNNKSSDRSNLTFFHTLLETHDIYVTDIYKVFFREGKRKSNTQKEYTKENPVHKDILNNEINIIKPQAILTLGNDARDAICQILDLNPPSWTDKIYSTESKENFKIIMVPHIAGSANGTKTKILNNLLYKSIDGENNVKYARMIINTLKENN